MSSSDTSQAGAADDLQPPLIKKLDSLRLRTPPPVSTTVDQGRHPAAREPASAPASAFTSASGQAAAADAARSPSARPPPSPMARGLLARRGSFTDRPIDVLRIACITQRNELVSLFAK
jgi:hypothetical protein